MAERPFIFNVNVNNSALTCTCFHSFHFLPLWIQTIIISFFGPVLSYEHHRAARCDRPWKPRSKIHTLDKPNWGFSWLLPSAVLSFISDITHWLGACVDMICIATAQILGSAKPLNNPITCELFTISGARSLLLPMNYAFSLHGFTDTFHHYCSFWHEFCHVWTMFKSLVWLIYPPEAGTVYLQMKTIL